MILWILEATRRRPEQTARLQKEETTTPMAASDGRLPPQMQIWFAQESWRRRPARRQDYLDETVVSRIGG